MSDKIVSVSAHIASFSRTTPYLGPLLAGEHVNKSGYFVRKHNRTVYPVVDRSVVIRIETRNGAIGWGETYGIVVPNVILSLVHELLADFVIGRNPIDVVAIHDELYDMMRVRGYSGGFYLDALAGIDIALWDLAAKLANLPLCEYLGGKQRDHVPAYISGLPKPRLSERASLAVKWQEDGFHRFKYAAPVSDEGVVAEMALLRERLGPSAKIACDLHWKYDHKSAIETIQSLEEHDLWFAEAPVKPEDVDGLARVSKHVRTDIAAGEEWRTEHDLRSRVDRHAIRIFQPEMGHTGITEFLRMSKLADKHKLLLLPHATIGCGIFLAASLQVCAHLPRVSGHEFQHSVFDLSTKMLVSEMKCEKGNYTVPLGIGLGIEVSDFGLNKLSIKK